MLDLFGRCTILVGFILPPNYLTGLQTPHPYSVSGASALRGVGWGSVEVTEASSVLQSPGAMLAFCSATGPGAACLKHHVW